MNNPPVTRFVGIDLHKHFVVIAAVDAQQQIVLDDFPAWAQSHLGPTDAVVLTYGGKPRGLAPVDEILALFPELAPAA